MYYTKYMFLKSDEILLFYFIYYFIYKYAFAYTFAIYFYYFSLITIKFTLIM